MGLIGTKKHPNNQQSAAERGEPQRGGWYSTVAKKKRLKGEIEDGLSSERQHRVFSLPLSPFVSRDG